MDAESAVSSWRKKYGEDALIQSVRSSNHQLFLALLDAGEDINSNDYLYSRDGRIPTLAVHVAAAHEDPRFLVTLLDRGAIVDDACQLNYPASDNVFRAAVRAGRWDNLNIIITAGGVNGLEDNDRIWEEWCRIAIHEAPIAGDADADGDAAHLPFLRTLFSRSWANLAALPISLPDVELMPRRRECFRFDALGAVDSESLEDMQALSNLEWLITESLSHLDDARRCSIALQLISGGADVAYYSAPDPSAAWDRRAALVAAADGNPLASVWAPLSGLPTSYYMATTPLHQCISTHNTELLRALLADGKLNPNVPEFATGMRTPLQLALAACDRGACEVLIAHGAAVDYISPIMQTTTVRFAAAARDASLLRWFLGELQARLSEDVLQELLAHKSVLGHSPLHVACLPSSPPHATASPARCSIHYALPSGRAPDAAVLQAIVNSGAGSWEDTDHQGASPAHYLAATLADGGRSADDNDCWSLILDSSLRMKNEFGFTPTQVWI
ncbi:hypothetical protein BC834DRAFT_887560 [Gloeopeniophorella convolvens]|nr:hypothetical protein BC834DRAFT_887560 [Gloeopeniophorella convolvens]